jgi:poly(hydroxyalkanoate) granule-associated protein
MFILISLLRMLVYNLSCGKTMNNTFDDIKNRAKSISDTDLTKKIQDSANNVLQVGLGALAKQQEDTTKIFDALVKQGQDIESKTKGVVKQQLRTAEDRVEEVKKAAQETVTAVRGKAHVSIDKIEGAVQDGVSQAIQNIGLITNEQVAKLNRRIDELERSLERLETKLK